MQTCAKRERFTEDTNEHRIPCIRIKLYMHNAMHVTETKVSAHDFALSCKVLNLLSCKEGFIVCHWLKQPFHMGLSPSQCIKFTLI